MSQNITEIQMGAKHVDYKTLNQVAIYQMFAIWFLLLILYIWTEIQRIRFYRKKQKQWELEINKANEDLLYQKEIEEIKKKEMETLV
jgi:hypothetical protein